MASLAENQSGKLLKNLIKVNGIPIKIKERIITRTGGNPFFIEEVVRSFIDEGAIKILDDKFLITDKIDHVSIPESINEVLMSRIDKLDEPTRSLLKKASVIGRSFYYRILAKVAEETD